MPDIPHRLLGGEVLLGRRRYKPSQSLHIYKYNLQTVRVMFTGSEVSIIKINDLVQDFIANSPVFKSEREISRHI